MQLAIRVALDTCMHVSVCDECVVVLITTTTMIGLLYICTVRYQQYMRLSTVIIYKAYMARSRMKH